MCWTKCQGQAHPTLIKNQMMKTTDKWGVLLQKFSGQGLQLLMGFDYFCQICLFEWMSFNGKIIQDSPGFRRFAPGLPAVLFSIEITANKVRFTLKWMALGATHPMELSRAWQGSLRRREDCILFGNRCDRFSVKLGVQYVLREGAGP